MVRFSIIFILVLSGGYILSNCGKPSDQKAYEEVLGTMSMEKARIFFDKYPKSQYRDKLINEIVAWCKKEDTESSYKIAIEALPKDHPRYKELVNHFEERFASKK